jgi:hypothetical protein
MSALENAVVVIELEERERVSVDRAAGRRLARALRLALDLETFEALLAGEQVPVDRLDSEWIERLGRRER